MTLYSIPMIPKEYERKAVEANSIKEAIVIAEHIWPHLKVADLCLECGAKVGSGKALCPEHFNEWYYKEAAPIVKKWLKK